MGGASDFTTSAYKPQGLKKGRTPYSRTRESPQGERCHLQPTPETESLEDFKDRAEAQRNRKTQENRGAHSSLQGQRRMVLASSSGRKDHYSHGQGCRGHQSSKLVSEILVLGARFHCLVYSGILAGLNSELGGWTVLGEADWQSW